jgi:phosphoribosyl-AMP cyclohydrolase
LSGLDQQWLNKVNWNETGLVAVIVQDVHSSVVLMMAWMNRDALLRTAETGEAVYWSRSRKKLWHKGEQSGHMQTIHEIRLDCDGDALLIKVEQRGGIACHTGRRDCFFSRLEDRQWVISEPVLKDPTEIYHE